MKQDDVAMLKQIQAQTDALCLTLVSKSCGKPDDPVTPEQREALAASVYMLMAFVGVKRP